MPGQRSASLRMSTCPRSPLASHKKSAVGAAYRTHDHGLACKGREHLAQLRIFTFTFLSVFVLQGLTKFAIATAAAASDVCT